MTAPTTAIARVAGRDEILWGAVMPVMVKMVHAQRVSISRVDAFPSHRAPAPVTLMRAGTDGVVQDHPVNVSAPVGHGDRVSGELPDAIALRVQRLLRLIEGAGSREALTMQGAQAVPMVRPVAPLNVAAFPVSPPVDIAIVHQAPVVHLAKPFALVRLVASLDRAQRIPFWPLKRAEWITVPEKAKTVSLAIAVRVMPCMAAINRAFAHAAILLHLRARDPSFYGATYCVGCRLHRPVGKHGEFTWLDERGNDTHVLVGT